MAAYNLVIGILTVLLVYVHTGRFSCAYNYILWSSLYKTMHLCEHLHIKVKLLDQEMYFFKILT
jgi:hypothetical protein